MQTKKAIARIIVILLVSVLVSQVISVLPVSAQSASVSVAPDPVPFGMEVQISGVVSPAAVYYLFIEITKPDGSSEIIDSVITTAAGDFQVTYLPSSGLGTYGVDVFEVSIEGPAPLLASTSFDVTDSSLFMLTQGGVSWQVEPIHGTVPAEEFYDYTPGTAITAASLYFTFLYDDGINPPITKLINPPSIDPVAEWMAGPYNAFNIVMQISPVAPGGQVFHGLTLTVDHDGVITTMGPFSTSSDGLASIDYLLDVPLGEEHDFTFTLDYLGESFADGSIYSSSETSQGLRTVGDEVYVPGLPNYVPPTLVSPTFSGNSPYMEATISKIYLYEYLDQLSLIIHHGAVADGSPEADIHLFISVPDSPYLPSGQNWVVKDDYDHECYVGTPIPNLVGYWHKEAGGSDGGVIGNLKPNEDWSLTVTPQFIGGLDVWAYQQADEIILLEIHNPITITSMAPGPTGSLVVTNVAKTLGGASPEDWNYELALFETPVKEFPIPSNESVTFTELIPGTYWVIQTRKFNYTTTSTTVDGFETPNEILGNAVFLELDVTADTTTTAVFSNAAIPESANAKSAGSGDSSELPVYNMPSLRAIPVQVSWDPDIAPADRVYDLVMGRPTKIMVKLADLLANGNPPNPLGTPLASGDSVTIHVTSSDGFFTSNPLTPGADPTRSGAQISSGNNVVIFSMNPPSTSGSYTITCAIEHGGSVISTFDTLVKVRETAPLLLYYSHVYRAYPPDYGKEPAGTSGDAYDVMLTKSLEFVKAVYPVSQVNVVSDTAGFQGATYEGGDAAMFKDCTKVWLEGMAHYNNNPAAIGIAIAPDLALGGNYKSYFKYNGAVSGSKVAVGVSFGPATRGVVVSDGYYSAVAHEIGHVFGLYYGIPEQYTLFNPGAPANGFWVEQNQWRSGYDFMGLSTLRSTTSAWVSTDLTFEPIFSVVKTAPDPRIIFVNGMIYRDGSVELPPEWYYLPYGTADTVPAGDFAVRFTTASGTYETSFAAQFFMNLDPGIEAGEDLMSDFTGFGTIPIDFAGFAFRAEYPTGTTKIELVDHRNGANTVIATIPAERVVSALSAGFGGFLSPIKADGSSSFKKGNPVPVKFQLKTPGGDFITTAQARLYLKQGSGPEIEANSLPKSTTGNLFRYDEKANYYIFNLDTTMLAKVPCQLMVDLGDGTARKVVNIIIR